jgi:hypothetical protein
MKTKKSPDDILEGPGFTMKRRGRFLELKTRRSPEEQRELRKRMWESRPAILAEIQSKTAEFISILHKYTSLDLVANLLLHNVIHDPNEYKESESKLRPHFVEHAAVLELKDPQYQLRPPVLVEGEDAERAQLLLEDIFAQSIWYHVAENADPERDGPPSRIDELRFFTLLHGMSVRSPAYSSHWREVLVGLFGNGSAIERLSADHSLDVHTALAIVDAIENFITGAMSDRIQKAREAYNDISSRLKEYKKTGIFKGEAHEKELFDRVRNMRPKEAKKYLKYAITEWTRVALGTVLSFSVAQIAEDAHVSPERTEALLVEISTEFGSPPTDYLLPAPANILHERPVIRYNSANFCPAPHLLPWCIKPAFERVLSGTSYWNAYQKQRSSYLVGASLKYLAKMLSGATTYENLYYPLETGEEAELDGLVLFDRYALFVEGKAGVLGAARRGGPLRIKSQLEALVGDAADQVARAHFYVRNTSTPVFRFEAGGTLSFDKSTYTEHILIAVTLDDLDMFTAEMYKMRDIGVVTTPDLPWSVALTNLRAMSDVLTRSFEFTHFLRWRLASIENPSLSGGMDELNWLAVYLKEGPKRPAPPSGYDHLSFTSYTDDFDAYFLYREGARTIPAARPAQPLPSPMDRLCNALESNRAYSFTQAGECLLDLDFNERKEFARKLVELAFHESKGGTAEFVLEAESLMVKVVTADLSQEDSEAQVAVIGKHSGKRALMLVVTSLRDWRVQRWAVAT